MRDHGAAHVSNLKLEFSLSLKKATYITIVLDIDAKEKQNTTHNEDLSQSSKN